MNFGAGKMLKLVHGNLLKAEATHFVNTVNCVGVMGKGLALEFRTKYPLMFREYKRICDDGLLCPGVLHRYKIGNHEVINFPTKIDWRNQSEYEWIESGLDTLNAYIAQLKGAIIAIPALGCQNGGLDWEVVRGMITEKLANSKCELLLFQPR